MADVRDVELLDVAETVYHPEILSEAEIREKLPRAIEFADQRCTNPIIIFGAALSHQIMIVRD